MATNWNEILSNTNNLNDVLSILKKVLAGLETKADFTTINEALQDIEGLKVDIGAEVENVNTTLDQFQAKADDVIAKGFYTGYATETALKASLPAVSEMRARADDTRKIWRWNRSSAEGVVPVTGSWIDMGLGDYDKAKLYIDTKLGFKKPYETIIPRDPKNLFSETDNIVDGEYISTKGSLQKQESWARTNHIPVTAGQTYTLSGLTGNPWVGFFSSGSATTAVSHNYYDVASPYTFTVPAGITHIIFNLDSTPIKHGLVQLELGSAATSYARGYTYTTVAATSIVELDEFVAAKLAPLSAKKPYEVAVSPIKNLFNTETQIKKDFLLNTSGKYIATSGWKCSTPIPVTAGQTYTLSGIFGYPSGLAFFADSAATTAAVGYVEGRSNPYTFTVPQGCSYVAFNIAASDRPSYSNIQLEKGSVATAYEYGANSIVIDPRYVGTTGSTTGAQASNAKVVGGELTIKAGSIEQVCRLRKNTFTTLESAVFNYIRTYLDGTIINSGSDDVPPYYINGNEIGANHGYIGAILTVTAHNKTAADVGSVWKDESNAEYVILEILDVNKIVIMRTANNNPINLAYLTFTHKENAAHTNTMVASSVVSTQVKPVISKLTTTLSSDGIPINYGDVSVDYKDNFTVSESYGIVSRQSIIDYVKANYGAALTSYDSITPYCWVNNVYRFDTEGGVTSTHSLTVLEPVAFAKMMLVQSIVMAGTGTKLYIPKINPFTFGGISYDLSKGALITGVDKPTSNMLLSGAYSSLTQNPPDRYISHSSLGVMATGILPVLDGEPTARRAFTTRSTGLISTAPKFYHHFIDTESISSVAVGDCFAGKGYRKQFKLADTDKISAYAVYDSDADYYYLDYKPSVAKVDAVTLPAKLRGREFMVMEKSANVTLLSKVATSQIHLNILSSPDSGYLVLKFTK